MHSDVTDLPDDTGSILRGNLLLLLAAAVLLFVFYQGLALYPSLPDRIPTHFGFAGQPDAWSAKTPLTVFGILIVAAVLLLLMAFASSARLSPRYYNFPGKERLLDLPPDQQRYILQPVREGLAWMGSGLTIGLSFLTRDTWAIALGQRAAISNALLLIPMGLGFAAIFIGLLHTLRRLRDLTPTPAE
jgi:hypothetical protein